MRKRPARPLLLIDLALPRDVEASAADLQNVFLYNLDDLAKIAEQNRAAREAEIARCRVILAERADGLWKQVLQRAASAAGRQGAGARRDADGSRPGRLALTGLSQVAREPVRTRCLRRAGQSIARRRAGLGRGPRAPGRVVMHAASSAARALGDAAPWMYSGYIGSPRRMLAIPR